jgi:N-acetylglucosaminyldiphosphoundecaprenol N-acetyl-beta-D-mannosaminyltransferase
MEHVRILGCRVDATDGADAVRRIVTLAKGAASNLVVTLGTEMIVAAQRDELFRAALNSATLSLCDTIGVYYAARMYGVRIPERVTGVDLIDPLCDALAREGLPLYFLGGKGDTSARAAAALAARHPGLRIAGARDGYFPASGDAAVARAIAESGARVVLVGLGSPRQELWIRDHLAESGARVGIGVGGSFDVLAGNVERAPERWRRLNLEWLYRLVKEPQRWRRQLALPLFVLLALRERALVKNPAEATR